MVVIGRGLIRKATVAESSAAKGLNRKGKEAFSYYQKKKKAVFVSVNEDSEGSYSDGNSTSSDSDEEAAGSSWKSKCHIRI